MRGWPLATMLFTMVAFAQVHAARADGCSGAISRYRAVQENDLSMGHVAKSVYAQIKREIEAAEQACSAGQDAKATAMIRASQARHGYPTGI